jgi:hypothetical protein
MYEASGISTRMEWDFWVGGISRDETMEADGRSTALGLAPMPTWVDAEGGRVPVHPCVVCGRDAPVMAYPLDTLGLLGWKVGTPTTVVSWCGHANHYLPRVVSSGWVRLVPLRSSP